jgi:hypothetical protein
MRRARFPICRADTLASAFRSAGLEDVEMHTLEIPTTFATFDDYWAPFLGAGAGAKLRCVARPADRSALTGLTSYRDIKGRALGWLGASVVRDLPKAQNPKPILASPLHFNWLVTAV